jgi:hypothetical protein
MIAQIRIEYKEFDAGSYEGTTIEVHRHGAEKDIFSLTVQSNEPGDDMAAILMLALVAQAGVVYASSVDNFMLDGGKLDGGALATLEADGWQT